MERDQLIEIEAFCDFYEVEYSFVDSLSRQDLIEVIVVEETRFLHIPELQRIERMVRLHHDLDINVAGIEAINTLLGRIDQLDREILLLRNRLRFYEPD
jgi:chaperone modulatory protein CbpM